MQTLKIIGWVGLAYLVLIPGIFTLGVWLVLDTPPQETLLAALELFQEKVLGRE